jgi:hypothetical protein
MIEEEDRPATPQVGPPVSRPLVAANDNGSEIARTQIDPEMLTIARLIVWRLAREEFGKRMAQAANDNFQGSTTKP